MPIEDVQKGESRDGDEDVDQGSQVEVALKPETLSYFQLEVTVGTYSPQSLGDFLLRAGEDAEL